MSGFTALVRRLCNRHVFRGALATAGLFMFLGSNLGAGCASSSQVSSIDVPMEFKPRSADLPVMRPPSGQLVKLYVAPTVDTRNDPRTIGNNTEGDHPIPVYAAGKTPADFVTDVLKEEMTTVGLDVASDVASSQRQIDSELLKFEVNEDNTYKSTVQLKVKVVDPTGKEIYTGIGTGTGSNYGKSKSAENYQQTYSDALRKAISDVLSDPKFTDAVSTK